MSTLKIYNGSLKSDAAYIDFAKGDILPDSTISNLNETSKKFYDRGWTQDQFEEFRSKFLILDHFNGFITGLSMTLFEDRTSGELTLAFRGTEPVAWNLNPGADLVTDFFVAIGLSEPFLGLTQVYAIRDFLQKNNILDSDGDANPSLLGKIDVVGHSLGGHLSAMFALDYPELINEVTTFNGAGISFLDEAYNYLKDFFRSSESLAAREALEDKVTNVYADHGMEVTASRLFFDYLGNDLPVFIEPPSTDFDAHSMYYLVDAFSVVQVLDKFEHTLSVEQMVDMLRQAANRPLEVSDTKTGEPDVSDAETAAVSLSTVLSHLSKSMGGVYSAFSKTNDAADFATTLDTEQDTFYLKSINQIADLEWTATHDPSYVGRAVRFALLENAPFVLIPGVSYAEGIFASTDNADLYGVNLQLKVTHLLHLILTRLSGQIMA